MKWVGNSRQIRPQVFNKSKRSALEALLLSTACFDFSKYRKQTLLHAETFQKSIKHFESMIQMLKCWNVLKNLQQN